MAQPAWVICQIGAREHYALARALYRRGALAALVTDLWVAPHSLLGRGARLFGKRIGGRHHAALKECRVVQPGLGGLVEEAVARVTMASTGWAPTMRRNARFQARVVKLLTKRGLLRPGTVVFAYSYAALEILRAAKAAGCVTVLGQIDPAIVEEDIVAEAVASRPELGGSWQRAPAGYWDLWRQEVAVADHVMVNSPWSRDALLRAGVQGGKVRIVPLAIEAAAAAAKSYPATFDAARPLRVLFLGSLFVRKGIAETFDAIRLLRDAPVRFQLVGEAGVDIPDDIASNAMVSIVGAVDRSRVAKFYEEADLFLIPTLSDGFALTMLEAMARGLPVVSSTRCGAVVANGDNGILLDTVSGVTIAAAVREILRDPSVLGAMSVRAVETVGRFSLDQLGARLLEMVGRTSLEGDVAT